MTYILINFAENPLDQIMDDLFRRNILSLIVEGGQLLLDDFVKRGLWDEARVEIAPLWLGNGIKAPKLDGQIMNTELFDDIQILTIRQAEKLD